MEKSSMSSRYILNPVGRFIAAFVMCVAAVFAFAAGGNAAFAAELYTIADDGSPAAPIRVQVGSSKAIVAAADDLADRLGRMVGSPFVVRKDLDGPGIIFALAGSADSLPDDATFSENIDDREAYLIRSTADRLYVIGATELALEHAVEDLLWRLGYRHYFPSEAWEIVPDRPNLQIEVDAIERPDYLSRKMSYGLGGWFRRGPSYSVWAKHNRMTYDKRASLALQTAHAYAGIASSNEDVWQEHPEWLALLNQSVRKRNEVSQKFCTSNEDFREWLRGETREHIERNPAIESFSRDPSDLGNWCTCDNCKAFGSISDQAFALANDAAEVANEIPGGPRYVGMHAYAKYAMPPEIDVHPNVIVSIATALNGGHNVNDLIAAWSPKVEMLGIRDYWSVYPWDHDLPGRARAARLHYMTRSIPDYHSKGVRFMTTEASENWGCNGLGYYLGARMLWDVDEAKRADELIDDFLTKSFGSAHETMGRFYETIHPESPPKPDAALFSRLYRLLAEARVEAAGDEGSLRRTGELACYVRYVELYLDYRRADRVMVEREIPIDVSAQNAPEFAEEVSDTDSELGDLMGDVAATLDPEEAAKRLTIKVRNTRRQIAYETLAAWSWRTRKMGMSDSIGVWRDIPKRDGGVRLPIGATLENLEADNRLKSSEPFTNAEFDALIADGIARNQSAAEVGVDDEPADEEFQTMSEDGDDVPAGEGDE